VPPFCWAPTRRRVSVPFRRGSLPDDSLLHGFLADVGLPLAAVTSERPAAAVHRLVCVDGRFDGSPPVADRVRRWTREHAVVFDVLDDRRAGGFGGAGARDARGRRPLLRRPRPQAWPPRPIRLRLSPPATASNRRNPGPRRRHRWSEGGCRGCASLLRRGVHLTFRSMPGAVTCRRIPVLPSI
jgi:hypothetical protein